MPPVRIASNPNVGVRDSCTRFGSLGRRRSAVAPHCAPNATHENSSSDDRRPVADSLTSTDRQSQSPMDQDRASGDPERGARAPQRAAEAMVSPEELRRRSALLETIGECSVDIGRVASTDTAFEVRNEVAFPPNYQESIALA